jgi:hypothetical protein
MPALRVGRSPYEWIMAKREASPVMRSPRGSPLDVEFQSEARNKPADFLATTWSSRYWASRR